MLAKLETEGVNAVKQYPNWQCHWNERSNLFKSNGNQWQIWYPSKEPKEKKRKKLDGIWDLKNK